MATKEFCDICEKELTGDDSVTRNQIRIKKTEIFLSITPMFPNSGNVDEDKHLCMACLVRAAREDRLEVADVF